MFESLRSDLLEQVETVFRANGIANTLRAHLDHLNTSAGAHVPTRFEQILLEDSPPRLPWLVCEHCAALTRIYSILEIFISSFTEEICSILSGTYKCYDELSERVKTAYRKGIAKILGELEEKHYHKDVDLKEISSAFADGVVGKSPFKLFPQPFLAYKRAFRFEQILSHLADLGLTEIEQQLLSHPLLKRATANRDPLINEKEAYRGQLSDFIDARNEAAHTDVTDVWKTESVRDAAYLIRDLCLAIIDVGERSMLQLQFEKQKLTRLGKVTELHSSRKGLVFTPTRSKLLVGDSIILVGKAGVRVGTAFSMQVNDQNVEGFESDGQTEVGLYLNERCYVGDEVCLEPESAVFVTFDEEEFLFESDSADDEPLEDTTEPEVT